MIYLIVTVFTTTCWALCYKVASHTNCNLIGVNTGTYLSATLLMGIYLFINPSYRFNLVAGLIGIMGGVSLFIAILTFFHVVKEGDLGPCWTIIGLSVMIPVLISIFVWAELPTRYQVMALLLICLSLILLGDLRWRSGHRSKLLFLLLAISFLTTGLTGTTAKMLQEMGLGTYKETYIFFLYFSGLILILILATLKGVFPGRKELAVGGVMGMVGILNSLFFLSALQKIPGVIAFPVRDVGGLILTTTASSLLWKEAITPKRIFGIAIAIIAIILINI